MADMKGPLMQYRRSLQWYRSANRCRFYRSSVWIRNGLYVIVGFSWWRGRVIMREVTAGGRVLHYARAGDFVECNASDFEKGQMVFNF